MCTHRLSAFCTVEHRGRHAEVCAEVLQQPEVHQLLLLWDSPQTRRGAAVKGQGELRLSPLLLCTISLVRVLSVDQRPCVLQEKAPADGAEVGLPPKRARLEEDPHCEPAARRRSQGAAESSLIPPNLADYSVCSETYCNSDFCLCSILNIGPKFILACCCWLFCFY